MVDEQREREEANVREISVEHCDEWEPQGDGLGGSAPGHVLWIICFMDVILPQEECDSHGNCHRIGSVERQPFHKGRKEGDANAEGREEDVEGLLSDDGNDDGASIRGDLCWHQHMEASFMYGRV